MSKINIYYQYCNYLADAQEVQHILNLNFPNNFSLPRTFSLLEIIYVYQETSSIDFLTRTFFSFYFEDKKPILDRILTTEDFEKMKLLI